MGGGGTYKLPVKGLPTYIPQGTHIMVNRDWLLKTEQGLDINKIRAQGGYMTLVIGNKPGEGIVTWHP